MIRKILDHLDEIFCSNAETGLQNSQLLKWASNSKPGKFKDAQEPTRRIYH
jgi:hypothetical protein